MGGYGPAMCRGQEGAKRFSGGELPDLEESSAWDRFGGAALSMLVRRRTTASTGAQVGAGDRSANRERTRARAWVARTGRDFRTWPSSMDLQTGER